MRDPGRAHGRVGCAPPRPWRPEPRGTAGRRCLGHSAGHLARSEPPKSTLYSRLVSRGAPPHASPAGKRLILGQEVRTWRRCSVGGRRGSSRLLGPCQTWARGCPAGECHALPRGQGKNRRECQHAQKSAFPLQAQRSSSESSGSRMRTDTPPHFLTMAPCTDLPRLRRQVPPRGLKPPLLGGQELTAPASELPAFSDFSRMGSENT